MVDTDIRELLSARVDEGIRPTYGYYRQPNGWITVSPMTDLDELKYRREGWTPLPQYGKFQMATEYAADHPLEGLLMQGGASELSAEQVIAQGLYMDPPLLPSCHRLLTQYHPAHNTSCWNRAQRATFPQIEGRSDLGPFACRFCGTKKPTVEARAQHEGVAHKEEKGDIRTGETLAEALVKGLKGTSYAQEGHAPSVAEKALDVLSRAGLTKKQRDALRALGIDAGEDDETN